MKAKEEIIKIIQSISGKYSPYQVFYDWVKCCAIAISNVPVLVKDDVWKKREEDYKSTIQRYEFEERKKFQKMFSLLAISYEERIEDVLGEIYMKAGCFNKELGQFFTPYHLAELNAAVGVNNITEDEEYLINEPSTGGGANIIGLAKVLNDKGINYQKCLKVYAQDLDWLGVYMSYVQFSLLGIKAKVAQGDTLKNPFNGNNYPQEKVFITPSLRGCIL